MFLKVFINFRKVHNTQVENATGAYKKIRVTLQVFTVLKFSKFYLSLSLICMCACAPVERNVSDLFFKPGKFRLS